MIICCPRKINKHISMNIKHVSMSYSQNTKVQGMRCHFQTIRLTTGFIVSVPYMHQTVQTIIMNGKIV